ncbi:hypothetical protein CVU83_01090 [Candidatus Falkowbacteria bacterium HGW-Falkowbacteria-2]|uniref:Transcription elongation factor GreA n=1 Tax=Candidatus Falkowbacteria bacterium HGW-Falkowbacteria-2 TaxID=2013769 RepID=A0A2N2E2A3_9BACT|nr:MAG: hypothetical protein CVU83_01090 [Candidatus Falkowbacteria bacterium HGW-Falkowbacteria-2]
MQTPHRRGENNNRAPKDYKLSPEKYRSLEHKLLRLKARHPQEASEVKRLAEMGDFSENAGYQMAKSRLRGLNQRILDIEHLLKRAEIVIPDADTSTVKAGHRVTIETAGKEKTYTILGGAETDPDAGVISLLSPLGSSLLNKKVGDEISVTVNGKEKIIRIIKIEA